MELLQLRCYLAVADTLHFGKAAQRLEMLPASLSRHIKLLEDSLGTSLIARTTRHVSLTSAGLMLLEDAKDLIHRSDAFEEKARLSKSADSQVLRVGAIDSVAAGMIPDLLHYFMLEHPDIKITLMEQKTIRLLPRLLSGRLDVAFVRPPEARNGKLVFRSLFSETAVVAMPSDHRLAKRKLLQIKDLEDQPLIVPDRRSRPHSHDLTIKLFLEAGLTARVAQVAEEKQTIVNIVSAGLGLAIVPRWTMRLQVQGVTFVPIDLTGSSVRNKLSLAVTWVRGTHDPLRDALLDTLARHKKEIAETA